MGSHWVAEPGRAAPQTSHEAGDRAGTRRDHVPPARGCSRGCAPGTAPSRAARPPAAARPWRSTPAATASPGAAPGNGSHSQSLQGLKHHNTRTGTEGKLHQRDVKIGRMSLGEVMEGGGTAWHGAPCLSGVHEPLACVRGHPQQVLWVPHTPCTPQQLLTVTMRVFQAVEKTSAPSSPR